MLKLQPSYLLIFFLLFVNSCDRVKQKGRQVVNDAKVTFTEKKDNIGDRIIARYDAYAPNSRFNKKRFHEFFGFAPTADVIKRYCHADAMGIDHDYQFSFTCNTSTVAMIANNLELVKAAAPDNFSSGLWHNFSWWDSATITGLTPYVKKGEHQTFMYLWYDGTKSMAYYFEFDM